MTAAPKLCAPDFGPLAQWQLATAARLVRPADPTTQGPLADAAADPLAADTAAGRAGWALTAALYRQWRLFRLSSLAPLTLAVLGDRAAEVIDGYLNQDRGSTSYASRDAAGFLDYVRRSFAADSSLLELATLEIAFLTARLPAGVEPAPLGRQVFRSNRATVVVVPFDVLDLVRWACRHAPAPAPVPGGRAVLVAPGIAGWVRDAGAAEVTLWDRLGAPGGLTLPVREKAALTSLRAAGAVIGG